MKRRWYESDPTLSMAISLLQNLLPAQQDWMIHDMLNYLSREYPELMEDDAQDMHGDTLLFFNRHRRWQRELWRLLGHLKELSPSQRTQAALYMIDRMVMLDQGDFPETRTEAEELA